MSRTATTHRTTALNDIPADLAISTCDVTGPLRTFDLSGATEFCVGRDEKVGISLGHASVSRKHARILGGRIPTVEDLGSTNGTKLMGRKLEVGERALLAIGNVIEFGNVVAVVHARTIVPEIPAVRASGSLGGPMRVPPFDTKMRELYDLCSVVAGSDLAVLILGETGVGKEVYAAELHAQSRRAGKAFLQLNCAALPETTLEGELFGYERGAFTGAVQSKAGLFESADGGTVFLDEVGELSLTTQAKLLRTLECGEVMRLGALRPKRIDVRFVSATNRDLAALAALGSYRTDFFFRLNGVTVTLPPLRERKADIAPLVAHFLEAAAQKLGRPLPIFTPEAAAELAAYRWPGNVRELKHVVERALVMSRGEAITPAHLGLAGASPPPAPPANGATLAPPGTASLPPVVVPPAGARPLRDEFAEIERARILDTLHACGGNQSRAAKMLGMARSTLVKRLEAYQVVRPRKDS